MIAGFFSFSLPLLFANGGMEMEIGVELAPTAGTLTLAGVDFPFETDAALVMLEVPFLLLSVLACSR